MNLYPRFARWWHGARMTRMLLRTGEGHKVWEACEVRCGRRTSSSRGPLSGSPVLCGGRMTERRFPFPTGSSPTEFPTSDGVHLFDTECTS